MNSTKAKQESDPCGEPRYELLFDQEALRNIYLDQLRNNTEVLGLKEKEAKKRAIRTMRFIHDENLGGIRDGLRALERDLVKA